MHNWLVGLVLEVGVPAGAELLARPAVHHVEFFLSWSDLDTSLDTVGGEWTSAVDVPLVEDLLLNLGVTTSKVVEGLHMGFGSVGCECEIVVLEIESTTRNDDLLAGLDSPGHLLLRVERLSWDNLDANSAVTLQNDLLNFVAGE